MSYSVEAVLFYIFFCFALTVIPGPPRFSLTIQLRNPFPCPVTFVTGQRLLNQSFPDSASRLCTVGSATRPSSFIVIILGHLKYSCARCAYPRSPHIVQSHLAHTRLVSKSTICWYLVCVRYVVGLYSVCF